MSERLFITKDASGDYGFSLSEEKANCQGHCLDSKAFGFDDTLKPSPVYFMLDGDDVVVYEREGV